MKAVPSGATTFARPGVESHDVEVAFDEHCAFALADGVARLPEAQGGPLHVDRGLRRIDVLRRRLARRRLVRGGRKGATAERDDLTVRVDDRKHQAVAEAIVVAACVRARHEETKALADRRRESPAA